MQFREFVSKFRDTLYYKVLELNLRNCTSVLDVGCGSNSPLRYVKKTFKSEGVDIYKQSINITKKNKIHETYRIADIKKLEKYYNPKSFDAVIALDVIEHFYKEDGLKLIEKMEKIARKKVIILTPNEYLDLGHCHENNPYQEHKSGWTTEDLKKLGYTVYGLRSFKTLRGEFSSIKYRPWIIWGFIAFITEPMLYRLPNLAFHLFAIKDLRDGK